MPLLLLMLDGVSAETFALHRARMPHLAALAERGMQVDRLHAEIPGTSLPGRASILTGVGGAEHGIYGNMLWDGVRFRYAAPDDLRVPTLLAQAMAVGLRTASVGMGMVRPEECGIFIRPWWVGAFLQRGRDGAPHPAEGAWERVAGFDGASGGFAQRLAEVGLPERFDPIGSSPSEQAFAGFLGDQRIAQWVGTLAASAEAPDLIVAEFLMTDTVQHRAGYHSPLALWSLANADALVGDVLARLQGAADPDRFDVVVLSDHGHGPIESALRPDALLPGVRYQAEGGVLHVVPRDAAERDRVTGVLAEFDAHPINNAYMPADARAVVVSYLAPDGVAFEHDATTETLAPRIQPNARSSHGARPGHPADDRFFVAAGPRVPRGRIATAAAPAVAATLARLLGLPPFGQQSTALFDPIA